MAIDRGQGIPEQALAGRHNRLATVHHFTGDGSTVAFTITGGVSDIPNVQSLIITIDGVTQHTDTYSTSETVVTFTTAPPDNSDIQVRYNAYVGTANTTSTVTYDTSSGVLSSLINTSGVLFPQAGTAGIYTGTGTPESSITAVIGSLYLRTDGGAGTTIYAKESGTGNTGWTTL